VAGVVNGGFKMSFVQNIGIYLRRKSLALGLVLLFFGWLVPQAQAAQFISNERITVDRPVNDNLYLFGNTIDIDAPVRGDLVIFGNDININKNVSGDVFVAGSGVNISSQIKGSLRVAGANVFLDSKVSEDVLVLSNTFRTSSNNVVKRDLVLAANYGVVGGTVKGSVNGSSNNLTIGAVVGKDVKLNVNKLLLSSTANLKGSLHYVSLNKSFISKKAKVKGVISRTTPARQMLYGQISGWLRSLVGMLLVAFLLVVFMPATFKNVAQTLEAKPWASPALGFALLILTPFFAVFLAVTVIGLPLALILLTLYLGAIYFAQIYVAAVVGAALRQRLAPAKESLVVNLVIGVTVLAFIRLLPLFGFLATLLIIIFGFGALVLTALNWWQQNRLAS
jgi:hypothetical protein